MRSDFTQLYSEKKTARLPRVTESLFRVYESYDNNPRPKSNKGSPVQPHSRSVMVNSRPSKEYSGLSLSIL